jgi:hypothetical protein
MNFDRRTFIKDAGIIGGLSAIAASCSSEPQAVIEMNGTFKEKLLTCLGGPWPEACDLKPQVKRPIIPPPAAMASAEN